MAPAPCTLHSHSQRGALYHIYLGSLPPPPPKKGKKEKKASHLPPPQGPGAATSVSAAAAFIAPSMAPSAALFSAEALPKNTSCSRSVNGRGAGCGCRRRWLGLLLSGAGEEPVPEGCQCC